MSQPSPLSELGAPPAVLRPERIEEEEGWAVHVPWSMPRALTTGLTLLSVIVGMSPVIALQTLDGEWTDSLCVLGPLGLTGVAIAMGMHYGIRFALGRAFCTRFELRPDGVRVGKEWFPIAAIPEATRTHQVQRSRPNEGGSTSARRVDWLHLGDRVFACDVGGESADWLATAINRLRDAGPRSDG